MDILGKTFTSVQNGAWGTTSTWDKSGHPDVNNWPNDDVIIEHTVTAGGITMAGSSSSITINNNGSLIITNTLNVLSGRLWVEENGALSGNNIYLNTSNANYINGQITTSNHLHLDGNYTGSPTIDVGGNLLVGTQNISVHFTTLELNVTGNMTVQNASFRYDSGFVNVGGNFDLTGTGSVYIPELSILDIGNNLTINSSLKITGYDGSNPGSGDGTGNGGIVRWQGNISLTGNNKGLNNSDLPYNSPFNLLTSNTANAAEIAAAEVSEHGALPGAKYKHSHNTSLFDLIDPNVSGSDKIARPNKLGTTVLISPDGSTVFVSCPSKPYSTPAYHEMGVVHVAVRDANDNWTYQKNLRTVDQSFSGVAQASHNHFGTSMCCSTNGNLLFTGNKHQHVFHYNTVGVTNIEDADSGGNQLIKVTTSSNHDFQVGEELRISESYYYTPPRRHAPFTVQSVGSNWVILDGIYVNGTTIPANTKIGRSMRSAIGDVTVFERSVAGVWSFKYKISDGITSSMNIVTGPYTGDTIGYSVSCSSDGSILAVGSPTKESAYTGEIYVFVQNGNVWEYKSKLSDNISITDHYRLGSSVHVSASGTKLIGGTCAQSKLGMYPTVQYEGEAWIADISATGVLSNETALSSLVNSSLYTGASTMKYFGKNVKISSNGTRAFVASGVTVTVGSLTYGNSGDVHIFDHNGTAWVHTINLSTLIPFNAGNIPSIGGMVPAITNTRGFLTDALDISDDGNNVIVGACSRATSYQSNSYSSGQVFSFRYSSSTWERIQDLASAVNSQEGILYSGDKFGSSVSTSSDCSYCIIGHRERRQTISGTVAYLVGDAYVLNSKISPIMTFPLVSSATYGSSSFTLNATCVNDSTGVALSPITYSSSDSNVISVSGTTASIAGQGSCTLTASYAGDSDHVSSSIIQNITIDSGNVVFSFQSVTSVTYGDDPITLSATGINDSGGAVTSLVYSSSDTSVISVSGTTATVVGAGTCILSVTSSDANYNGISTQPVTVAKADQDISNFNYATVKYIADTNFQLNASSDSSIAASYSSSDTGVISVNGTTATFVSTGTATITASFASNANYNAATATLIVTVEKSYQLISYTTGITTIGIAQQTGMTYSADSGLPVTINYTEYDPAGNPMPGGVISSPVPHNTIEGVGEGTVTFTLTQAGNGDYRAAAVVQITFTVQTAQTNAHPGLYNTGTIENFSEAPLHNKNSLFMFDEINDRESGLLVGDETERLNNFSEMVYKYRLEYDSGTLEDDYVSLKRQLRRTMRQTLNSDRTTFTSQADIQNILNSSSSKQESVVDTSRQMMMFYPDPDKAGTVLNLNDYSLTKNLYIDLDEQEVTVQRNSYSASWKMNSDNSALLINDEPKSIGTTVQLDDIQVTLFMFGSVGAGEGTSGGSATGDPIFSPLKGLPYQINTKASKEYYLLFDNKDLDERLIVTTCIENVNDNDFVEYCNEMWNRKKTELVAYMTKVAVYWNREWREIQFPDDRLVMNNLTGDKLGLPMYEKSKYSEVNYKYLTKKHGPVTVYLRKYDNAEMRTGVSVEGFGLDRDTCGALMYCPNFKDVRLKKLTPSVNQYDVRENLDLVDQRIPVIYDKETYMMDFKLKDRNSRFFSL